MNIYTLISRKRIIAAVMGVVLCFGVVFSTMPTQRAHAQSDLEIQLQILQLQVVLLQLQAQLQALLAEIEAEETVVDGEAAVLYVSEANGNPSASTFVVEEDDETGPFVVLVMEIEEKSDVDVEIEAMTFTIDIDGEEFFEVFDEAELYYDGDYEDADVDDEAGTLTFEDLGLDVDAGDEVDVTLKLYFEEAEDYMDEEVTVSVSFASIDEMLDENGNRNDAITVSGSLTGATHTLSVGDSSYSADDIDVVYSEEIDPIEGAIDDEYTLYTIILDDGREFEVKAYGNAQASMFEEALADTGYTGSTADFYKLVVEFSYGADDIERVTSEYVDPIAQAVDDEYTLYTIYLENGREYEVQAYGMAPATWFEEALEDTGYTGSLTDFYKLVETGEVRGASISVDPYTQMSTALAALSKALEKLQARL